MNRQHRQAFLMDAARLGLSDWAALKVTSLAATHHRLCEAECNGDWPCDNGERTVLPCSRCEARYVVERLYRDTSKPLGMICQSCRTEDRIRGLCEQFGILAEFQGDPRGWTVKLSKAAHPAEESA